MDGQNNDMNTVTNPTPAPNPTPNPAPNPTPNPALQGGQQGNPQPNGSLSGGTLLGGQGDGAANGGAPQGAPEDYDFTSSIPEGATLDEDTAKSFGDLARSMGLTNDQANQIAKYGFEWQGKAMEAYNAAQNKVNQDNIAQAKKELGADFDATVAKAGALVENLERQIPGIRELLGTSSLFSDVRMVKAFAYLGGLIAEDKGVGGSGAPAAKEDNPYPRTDWSKYKQ